MLSSRQHLERRGSFRIFSKLSNYIENLFVEVEFKETPDGPLCIEEFIIMSGKVDETYTLNIEELNHTQKVVTLTAELIPEMFNRFNYNESKLIKYFEHEGIKVVVKFIVHFTRESNDTGSVGFNLIINLLKENIPLPLSEQTDILKDYIFDLAHVDVSSELGTIKEVNKIKKELSPYLRQ